MVADAPNPVRRGRVRTTGRQPVDRRRGASPVDGLVDRWRSRRQPVRHRRGRALRRVTATRRSAFDHHLLAVERLSRRAVDVGPPGHADRRSCSSSPERPATTRRSAPTSRTGGRCAGCTPGSTRTPSTCSSTAWTISTAPPPRVAQEPLRVDRRTGATTSTRCARRSSSHGADDLAVAKVEPGPARRGDVRRAPVRARHAPELAGPRGGGRRTARRAPRCATTTHRSTRPRASPSSKPSSPRPRLLVHSRTSTTAS